MTNPIPIYFIHSHPLDFPDHFVVRRCVIAADGDVHPVEPPRRVETLRNARDKIPAGMVSFPADKVAMSDPSVIEFWVPNCHPWPVVSPEVLRSYTGPAVSRRPAPTVTRISPAERTRRLRDLEKTP